MKAKTKVVNTITFSFTDESLDEVEATYLLNVPVSEIHDFTDEKTVKISEFLNLLEHKKMITRINRSFLYLGDDGVLTRCNKETCKTC